MRTKTLLLSTLLGALGSVAVHAQTSNNVYSLNAVGYINVVASPGYNMISCPLIASPNNTIGTLLNNASGQYTGDAVYFYNTSTGGLEIDQAEAIGGRGTTNANGWLFGGTNVLAPGVACWFDNFQPTNVTLTFVGTVPSGSLTNTLTPGFNMVSSILPTSGDLASNSLTTLTNYNLGDAVYVYNAASSNFTIYQSGAGREGGFGYDTNWNAVGDPIVPNVGQGFWYHNSGATVSWVENYSVSE
jgi:hypothetical protein